MPRDIQAQVEQLYDTLLQELTHFRPGERFHSIRELVRRHGVSRRTVEHVLAKLAAVQALRIRPADGIYANLTPPPEARFVTIVHCDWPAEYWKILDPAIEWELREYPEIHLSRLLFDPLCGMKELLTQLAKLRGDAILFTFPIHHFSTAEIAAILALPFRVIFMENNLLCDGIDAVDTQPEYAGMLAAECLIRHGHRRLALILSEPWSLGDHRRNQGFLQYARARGLEPVVIDCQLASGSASCANAHEKVLAHLNAHGPNFSGCFTMSDYSALGVISAIKEFGLRVPDDISVIGHAGIPSGAHCDPPLTTIAIDIPGMAHAITAGLKELFSGGRFGIRQVPESLLERQSVKNVKKECKPFKP